MARLAISKDFLAEYVRLDQGLQRAVDRAIAAFARDSQPALHLEKPPGGHDDRIAIMPVNVHWHGVVLTPGDTSPEDTYSLVTVVPQDQVMAFVRYLVSHRAREVRAARRAEAISQLKPSSEAERVSAGVSGLGPARLGVPAKLRPTAPALPAAPAAPAALTDPVAASDAPASAMAGERSQPACDAAPPGLPTADDQVARLAEDQVARLADDPVACSCEPEKMPRRLAHPFAAWRARRRSRRLAGDGANLD